MNEFEYFIELLDRAFYKTGNIGYRNLKNVLVHPELFPFLYVQDEKQNTKD